MFPLFILNAKKGASLRSVVTCKIYLVNVELVKKTAKIQNSGQSAVPGLHGRNVS